MILTGVLRLSCDTRLKSLERFLNEFALKSEQQVKVQDNTKGGMTACSGVVALELASGVPTGFCSGGDTEMRA